MQDRYRKFRRLSASERMLFVESIALLALVALAIYCFGFKKSHMLLARLSRVRDAGPQELELRILAASRMVRAAARYSVFPTNCLNRSLVLWWLLSRQGIGGDLRIGVRKDAGRFEAHAWVEALGKVLIDGDDVRERFAAFAPPILSARRTLERM